VLLIPTLFLLILGLVMVYSASTHLAELRLGDGNFYLKRQALFCFLGLLGMIMAKNVHPRLLYKGAYVFVVLSLLLLMLVLIPGVGAQIGGARRWLKFLGFSLQPSEFAKFSLAVYMAYSMTKKGSDMQSFSKGLLPHLLMGGLFFGLILLQPDFGTAAILMAWMLTLLFVGGARLLPLVLALLAAAPVFVVLLLRESYRLHRWAAFLHPWEHTRGIAFQIVHSFLAFGSGGITGTGIGNSKQKLFYLPESHTDFILPIAGEELGFIGTAVIILLFGILIVRGIQVALRAEDLFASYLAMGLTCLLAISVLVNMGVVMGLLPTKGLTLPFISYGGSSLVINLLGVGVLLNISSRA
jgi:cell division protein FtsW